MFAGMLATTSRCCANKRLRECRRALVARSFATGVLWELPAHLATHNNPSIYCDACTCDVQAGNDSAFETESVLRSNASSSKFSLSHLISKFRVGPDPSAAFASKEVLLSSPVTPLSKQVVIVCRRLDDGAEVAIGSGKVDLVGQLKLLDHTEV